MSKNRSNVLTVRSLPTHSSSGELRIDLVDDHEAPKWNEPKAAHSQKVVGRAGVAANGTYRFGADSWACLDFDALGLLAQPGAHIDEAGEVVTLVQYRGQKHSKETQGEIGHRPCRARLGNLLPGFATWPASWCGEERDVIPGQQIVAVFTPFLLDLLDQGLSRKTRNLHRDNLWLLGGCTG